MKTKILQNQKLPVYSHKDTNQNSTRKTLFQNYAQNY
jgi:hypothetical protein